MKCKVCTREITEPNEFCIIHAVDGSFVERVRAALYRIQTEGMSISDIIATKVEEPVSTPKTKRKGW